MTELMKRPDDLRSYFYNRTGEQALIEFGIECSDDSYIKPLKIEMPSIEYMKHLEYMVLEVKAKVAELEKENAQLRKVLLKNGYNAKLRWDV